MSNVKIHKVKHRLARQLRSGAQLSVTTALGGAKTRVKKLEPVLLAAIGDEIDGMDAALSDLRRGESPAITHLYHAANRLLGLAGAAPRLDGLGKAALSLCDLLDALNGVVPPDVRPIGVHIDAMRILLTDLPERDQILVLAGLAQVRSYTGQRQGA